jgi:hypothetical protein
MTKLKFIFAGLTAVLFFACANSPKAGLKESWVDERDIMALMNTPVNEWMQIVGRPTLVEIIGDTSMYYYNYRPTLYLAVAYTEGKPEELKPTRANATEVCGSRKNLMQIKVVQNTLVSAIVVAGPDKKTYIRDLNGDLILDPKSGFTPDFSDEVKIKGDFDEFMKEYSTLNVKNPPSAAEPAAPVAPAVPIAPTAPEVPVAAPAPEPAPEASPPPAQPPVLPAP